MSVDANGMGHGPNMTQKWPLLAPSNAISCDSLGNDGIVERLIVQTDPLVTLPAANLSPPFPCDLSTLQRRNIVRN